MRAVRRGGEGPQGNAYSPPESPRRTSAPRTDRGGQVAHRERTGENTVVEKTLPSRPHQDPSRGRRRGAGLPPRLRSPERDDVFESPPSSRLRRKRATGKPGRPGQAGPPSGPRHPREHRGGRDRNRVPRDAAGGGSLSPSRIRPSGVQAAPASTLRAGSDDRGRPRGPGGAWGPPPRRRPWAGGGGPPGANGPGAGGVR